MVSLQNYTPITLKYCFNPPKLTSNYAQFLCNFLRGTYLTGKIGRVHSINHSALQAHVVLCSHTSRGIEGSFLQEQNLDYHNQISRWQLDYVKLHQPLTN